MITLPLKSQYVSLIITFVSGACELALLCAALRWNWFFEGKTLQNGRTVMVRNHLARTKWLATAATSVFLAVEVANSFYSDPTTIERLETRPCSFLAATAFQGSTADEQLELDLISLSCREADENTIALRGGNQFNIDGKTIIQCSETLFSFDREVESNRAVAKNYVVECVPASNWVEEEEAKACSITYRNGSKVTFSNPFLERHLQDMLSDPRLWETDVAFDVGGNEREIASRAALVLSSGIADELDVRRQIFTRNGEGMCDFRRSTDATLFNMAFAIVLVSLWGLCLLLFVGSLLLRPGVTYDMSDPLDWATKTLISDDVVGAENPAARCVERDGRRWVAWTDSTQTCGFGGPSLFRCRRWVVETGDRKEKQADDRGQSRAHERAIQSGGRNSTSVSMWVTLAETLVRTKNAPSYVWTPFLYTNRKDGAGGDKPRNESMPGSTNL